MAATLQAWHGKIKIGAAQKDFTLAGPVYGGPTARALTTGDYFIAGYSGESANQLVEHLEYVITNTHADFSSVTVTYSFSTNKVTIADGAGSGNLTIGWVDTALRDMLGFDSDVTVNGSSVTATNECAFCWMPNRSMSFHPVGLHQFWAERSTTLAQVANDGTLTTIEAQKLKEADVDYSHIAKARVIIPSTGSVNIEFQQFYSDVIHKGYPVRLYPDKDTDTTLYKTLRIVGDEGIPPLADMISRNVPAFDDLWRVSFAVRDDS